MGWVGNNEESEGKRLNTLQTMNSSEPSRALSLCSCAALGPALPPLSGPWVLPHARKSVGYAVASSSPARLVTLSHIETQDSHPEAECSADTSSSLHPAPASASSPGILLFSSLSRHRVCLSLFPQINHLCLEHSDAQGAWLSLSSRPQSPEATRQPV